MPLKSQAQRAWMHINEPETAARWERETPGGKRLPRRVKNEYSTWVRSWAPDEEPDPKPNGVECDDDGHMSLYEMFALNETMTGRELHGWLDAIMDMAEEGRDYERDLQKLRAETMHLAAAGDVGDWFDMTSQERADTHRLHGRDTTPVPKDYHQFDFDYVRDRKRANGSILTKKVYKGPETDPETLIAYHRTDAHIILANAFKDVKLAKNFSSPPNEWFDNIEDDLNEIERLAKERLSHAVR